ncbi:MAG: hypothetical protein ACQEVA_19475 [Myxococcota bacterium]
MRIGLTGAALVALIGLPSTAFAQVAPQEPEATEDELDEDVDAMIEEEAEEKKPWEVSASLMTRVGQGTFVQQEPDTEFGREEGPAEGFANRVVNVYSLSPSYKLDDFTFSGSLSFSHWLTRGGGTSAVPYSSNANEPNEFRLQDIGLSAAWSGYSIEPIDTRVSANFTTYLPTSKVSQTENLILTNVLSGSLSKTFFEKLSLTYGLSGLWLPHSTTSPTIDPEVADNIRTGTLLADATSDLAGNGEAKIAGYNIEYGVGTSLSASIPVWKDLSFSTSYSLTKYWTYDIDNDDQRRSELEDENGVRVADSGRGTADISTTTLSLSYPVNDYLSLSGGLYTRGPVKTLDNKGFRFPFWNTNGAANNFSAVQLSIEGSY